MVGGKEREGVGEMVGGKERRWRKTDMHTLAFLQLKAHKRGIEESEVTINLLLKRQSEDKVHTKPCSTTALEAWG